MNGLALPPPTPDLTISGQERRARRIPCASVPKPKRCSRSGRWQGSRPGQSSGRPRRRLSTRSQRAGSNPAAMHLNSPFPEACSERPERSLEWDARRFAWFPRLVRPFPLSRQSRDLATSRTRRRNTEWTNTGSWSCPQRLIRKARPPTRPLAGRCLTRQSKSASNPQQWVFSASSGNLPEWRSAR